MLLPYEQIDWAMPDCFYPNWLAQPRQDPAQQSKLGIKSREPRRVAQQLAQSMSQLASPVE